MEGNLTELAGVLREIRTGAREAIEASRQTENEAAAASLLRRRMSDLAAAADGALRKMESPERQIPRRDLGGDSRQSTEESVRLAFSGVHTH